MSDAIPETAHHSQLLGQLPDFPVLPERSALLVIDMQYRNASREHGFGPSMALQEPDVAEYYFGRIEKTVVPNILSLIDASRNLDMPVIFTRNASSREDSRDVPWRRRYISPQILDGTLDATIVDALSPRPNDMVFSKVTASVFNSTNIHQVLAYMQIDTLVVCGSVTNMCVESTVRDAGDLGYQVMIAADACVAMSEQEHSASLQFLHRRFANVKNTSTVIGLLQAVEGIAAT